jgi:uncharacterized protein
MEQDFFLVFVIGFFAQLIDGALGMAYGVVSNTFLLAFGLPPAAASACIHTAEIFTTGVSGLAHWRLGNVDKELLKKLVVPGVLGAVLGAYFLTSLPVWPIRLVVAFYLAVMGGMILFKALKKTEKLKPMPERLYTLGFLGGLFDAMGGGGWGPIVTSNLVARGNTPRYVVGSVNLAEFFVALAASLAFSLTIGVGYWRIVLGLTLGGVVAAPFAAWLCKKLPTRVLMFTIGALIILLSVRAILHVLLPSFP